MLSRLADLAFSVIFITISSTDRPVRLSSYSTAAIAAERLLSDKPNIRNIRPAPLPIAACRDSGSSAVQLSGVIGNSRSMLVLEFCFLESTSKSKNRESEGEHPPPSLLNPVDVSDKPVLRERWFLILESCSL